MSDLKVFYVYEYVYDPIQEKYTGIEGEVQGYVKAETPFDACVALGFDDYNRYFANAVSDLDHHVKVIKNERKHINKVSKQLNKIVDEIEAEREEMREKRPCPNCGVKLDDDFNCPSCTFGHENDKE